MTRKKTSFVNTQKTKGFDKFFPDKILFIKFVYLALSFSVINIIIVAVMQKSLPPELPLFYGYTESEQQLSTPFGLLVPGTISLIITLINAVLSVSISSDFLKKALNVTSFLISLLLLITVLKIIFLVSYV